MVTRRRSHHAGFVGHCDFFGGTVCADTTPQPTEADRRREERDSHRSESRRRCGRWPGGAERRRPHVAARRSAEGAGQQAVRAVQRVHRSLEDHRRQGHVLLARRVERRGRRRPTRKDAKKDDKDKKGGRPEYAYEDLNTIAAAVGPERAGAHQPLVYGRAGQLRRVRAS